MATVHRCDIIGCNYKTKYKNKIKQHKINIHNIGIEWCYCDVDGCNHKAKHKGKIKQHKINIHNIGIEWCYCDVDDCKYKAKYKCKIKQHKINMHDIGIEWCYCDVDDCKYKAKHKGKIKQHKINRHDIGGKTCEICIHSVYSLSGHIIDGKNYRICRKCYYKLTGTNPSVEKRMSDYIDKHFGTEFLLASDATINGELCQRYRPDKLYGGNKRVIHIECDEYQHRRGAKTSYTCDEKRISDIYDEFPGKDYIVIRWNPHGYKSPPNKKKVTTIKKKLKMLLEVLNNLQKRSICTKIIVIYMFYSPDNPLITRNFQKIMIYDQADIQKFLPPPHNKISIVVCGSRYGFDKIRIQNEFTLINWIYDDVEIITGGCRGVDTDAHEIATSFDFGTKIFNAEWEKFGPAAGPIRNKQMVGYLSKQINRDILVLAFHKNIQSSKGTKNTINQAKDKNINIKIVK